MTRSWRKGYTIIEILFALAIAVVIIGITIRAFTAMNLNFRVATNYLSFYLTGRETIDFMSKDCRIAIRVMDGYSGYTTTNNSLVLKVPSIDADNNILDVNNEFDYIIYEIDSGDLRKTVIPGSNSAREPYDGVWKRSVKSLYLTSNDIPLSDIPNKSVIKYLTIRIAMEEVILDETYSINPGTTVKLMNYEWEYVR